MRHRRRFKKDGILVAPRGTRLKRKKRFEPTLKTKSGVMVRSQYEQRCADFFNEHNIDFQYEPLMLLGGRQYRPDFYLPDYKLFVEICGYGHFPFYSERQRQKQQVYEKYGMKAIFIKYSGRGSLEKILEEELAKAGIV